MATSVSLAPKHRFSQELANAIFYRSTQKLAKEQKILQTSKELQGHYK
jgi:hypothetical protein